MKLINYDYGFTPADPTSGTYYRGKIRMSYDEYKEVKKYLFRSSLDTFTKNQLAQDLQRQASIRGNGFHVCIRVPATEKLVAKYKLPRYKRQNYFLEVMPS